MKLEKKNLFTIYFKHQGSRYYSRQIYREKMSLSKTKNKDVCPVHSLSKVNLNKTILHSDGTATQYIESNVYHIYCDKISNFPWFVWLSLLWRRFGSIKAVKNQIKISHS